MIDRGGMAVSNTYTLEGGYGSHVVVKGAGFLLNNEMGDFNKNPGDTLPDGDIGTPANLIDPGKRMLSSMTPAIVSKGRQGRAGHRIAGRPDDHQHGLRVVLGVDRVRHERARRPSTRRACTISGCRIAVSIERAGASDELLAELKAMGHTVHAGRRAGGRATRSGSTPAARPRASNDKRSPDGKASVPRT